MALDLREEDGAVSVRVRVQPRAARDAVAGERDGALLVRLSAPPVEGAANDALRRLVGRALGIAPSRVAILRGATGREKILRVSGVHPDDLRALAGLSPDETGGQSPVKPRRASGDRSATPRARRG